MKKLKLFLITKPVSIFLIAFLVTELILRIADYFCNRMMNPDSENSFFIYNYSLRAVPFATIIVFLFVIVIILIIGSRIKNVKSDWEMVKGFFDEGCVVSKLILTFFLFGIIQIAIVLILEKVSDLSTNYAIYSLSNMSMFFIKVYSVWFSFLLMYWFVKNEIGKRVFLMICPILTILLFYRVILQNLFTGLGEWSEDMMYGIAADELGGVFGFLTSAKSFADMLINAVCCVAIWLIYYILKKSAGISNKMLKIGKISGICGIALLVMGFTPISSLISFVSAMFS